jgi:hypothetical protein
MLEAVKLRGRLRRSRELVLLDPLPDWPPEEIEVILLGQHRPTRVPPRKLNMRVHRSGQFLGRSLRREDIYGDDGR